MVKNIFILALIVLMVSSVSALTINNTIIHLTGLKSNISITYPWTLDNLSYGSSWFSVSNLSSSHPSQHGTYTLDFNHSKKGNYTGLEIPYVSAYSTTQIVLTSNVSTTINVTSFVISLPYAPLSINYHSGLANFSAITYSYNAVAHQLSVSYLPVERGSNYINITYTSTAYDSHVNNLCDKGYLAVGFAAIFILVAVGSMIMAFLSLKSGSPVAAITTIGGAVLALVIIGLMVASICG